MRRLLLVALAVVLLGVVLALARTARVRGASMDPTLRASEVLLVESVSPRLGRLRRGDIVIVEITSEQWLLSELAGGRFMKRVVGLPGETVAIDQGRVTVDGRALAEPYVRPHARQAPQTLAPVVVPAGAYYVLGDNRAESDDSRTWGPLPLRNVLGRVWAAIWPLPEIRLL